MPMKPNNEPLAIGEIVEQLGKSWKQGVHPTTAEPVAMHNGGTIYCMAETKRGGKFALTYAVVSMGDVEVRGVGATPELAYASFKRVLFAKTESLQEERKVLDAKLRAAYGLMAVI